MAVLKDVAATVVVNGKALVEHDPRDDHPVDPLSTMTRYIEATAGANFELKFEVKARSLVNCNGLNFRTSIDGVEIDSMILRADTTQTLKGARGLMKGKWHLRKFKFSNILLGLYSIDWYIKGITEAKFLVETTVPVAWVHSLAHTVLQT